MRANRGMMSMCRTPSVRLRTKATLHVTCADALTDQSHGNRLNSLSGFSDLHRRMSVNSQPNSISILPFTSYAGENRPSLFGSLAPRFNASDLPPFIKPLPAKIGPDEVAYLEKKGALTIPQGTLRSEMLRAYIEFVHPYMPLLELHEFLAIIDKPDGSNGKVSLILFQAVMFAGSAFIDMHHLRAVGYSNRKEARKDFFQKTRVRGRLLFSLGRAHCLGPIFVSSESVGARTSEAFACDASSLLVMLILPDPLRFRLRIRSRFASPSFASSDVLL